MFQWSSLWMFCFVCFCFFLCKSFRVTLHTKLMYIYIYIYIFLKFKIMDMSKSCIVWIHWILFGYPIAIQLLDLLIWKLDRYWVSLYTGCVNLKKSTIQLLLYHNVSTTTTIQTIQLLNTYVKICKNYPTFTIL